MGDLTDTNRKAMNDFLEAFWLSGGGLFVLAADPVSPINGQVWLTASGTSPSRTIALKVRDQGVTQEIIAITV